LDRVAGCLVLRLVTFTIRQSVGSGFMGQARGVQALVRSSHGDRAGQGHRDAAVEIYFRDDQSECIVLERYRDSEALAEHAANLGELGQAILATGLVSSELLGEPGAELRAALADSPVRLFTPFLSR